MPYIETSTGAYPLGATQIMAMFPNTSFPTDQDKRDEALAALGYVLVIHAPEPEHNPETHRINRWAKPMLVDGVWTLGWDVVPLTEEELDLNLVSWRASTSVTPRQFRLALLDAGLLDDVEAMIPNMPRAVQVEWEYSILLERGNPQWDVLGAAMSPPKTSEDIDNIFRHALSK